MIKTVTAIIVIMTATVQTKRYGLAMKGIALVFVCLQTRERHSRSERLVCRNARAQTTESERHLYDANAFLDMGASWLL